MDMPEGWKMVKGLVGTFKETDDEADYISKRALAFLLVNTQLDLMKEMAEALENIRLQSGSEISGSEKTTLQSQKLFRIYNSTKEVLKNFKEWK